MFVFGEVLDESKVSEGDGSRTWRIRVSRRSSSNLVKYMMWVDVHSTAFGDGSCTRVFGHGSSRTRFRRGSGSTTWNLTSTRSSRVDGSGTRSFRRGTWGLRTCRSRQLEGVLGISAIRVVSDGSCSMHWASRYLSFLAISEYDGGGTLYVDVQVVGRGTW